MENKDWAYQIIDNDAIKMNNGDNMVDVSTAYLAIDRARSDERHQLLAGWEPTTKSVPTTGLVDVLFQTGRSGRSWVTMYTTGFIPISRLDMLLPGGCGKSIPNRWRNN